MMILGYTNKYPTLFPSPITGEGANPIYGNQRNTYEKRVK